MGKITFAAALVRCAGFETWSTTGATKELLRPE
jgi:hypothetical protein